MKSLTLLLFSTLISSAQTITTFAGNGTAGSSGDNGPALQAEINRVVSLATDAAGNIYLADQNNNKVRKVDTNGVMTTFAGTGTPGFTGDNGPAAQAELNAPLGLCFDQAGDLYVNDEGNFRVRKITPAGIITTVAGSGSSVSSGDGGPALQAGMNIPIRCAVDAPGNLYIVDQGAFKVRKVDTNGIISTYAGTGSQGFSGDGGLAINASMNNPTAITLDTNGNLFITDQFNHRIREVDTSGIIQTVAGNGNATFAGDGGPATAASLNYPGSTVIDAAGSLYIIDCINNRVRKVSSGTMTTIAGTGTAGYTGDGGPATAAELSGLFAITLDGFGNLYIADTTDNVIRKISGGAVGVGPAITSVTNGASFQTGFAAATWVSIFGTNLSQTTRTWKTSDFVGNALPMSLDGLSVTINGMPAYVEYISATQVNVLAPDGAAIGNVQVQVTTPQAPSNSLTAQNQEFSPAFFTIGSGYVAALHLNYSLVAKTSLIPSALPAKPGEIIQLYGTGFGPTNPTVPTADLVSTAESLANPVDVTIGGQPATVGFNGIVGAGLYQLNVTIPASLPDGDAAIVAKIGGVQSAPGVLVTVQH